jgi:hypothetical protein
MIEIIIKYHYQLALELDLLMIEVLLFLMVVILMKLLFATRNLFILLFAFTSFAFANQFENPYQGSIVVNDQNDETLKILALQQVLIKVSGNTQVNSLKESKLLEKKAQSLLSQFGYRNYQNTRYFVAVFDKRKINQALQDMQQPIWGDTRPTTLMWFIDDDNSGRKIISDHMVTSGLNNALAQVVQKQQQTRGIKFQFPLMDLDDSESVSIADISGQFYDQIGKASQRYGNRHFSTVYLKKTASDKWSLQWALVYSDPHSKQNRVLISEKSSGQKTYILQKMSNKIADYYAGQYAILQTEGDKILQTVHVNGISSLQKLADLENLFSDILAISSYEIVSVDVMQVKINVKLNGGINSFKNALAVQTNLQRDSTKSEEFYFNWHQ